MKIRFYLITAISLLASTLYAQSYTEIVWTQMQSSYESMSEEDYVVKNYIIGNILEDDDTSWTFYLSSSKRYSFKGFCDTDCNDLDLYIYDSNNNEVSSDTEDDDFPIVYFSPSKSGRYKVEISMYSCAVEPCSYGLAIFEKYDN